MTESNVSPEVADLVTKAAALVKAEGRDQAATALLNRMNARRRPKPSVLVAGEDKRGKSSLVNALLGRPDLSPIGVEVVTGAPISFFYSQTPRAAIVRYGEPQPVATDFEEARRLATVQGNPQNEANIRAVQLGVDHPLLEKILLVDTPGVGGLHSGHAELTLQTLSFADALVFVLQAGAQFRAAELDFLRRASARIDTVILVLTKIDLFRGWRTILDDNIKILHEQAPRFTSSPVVPVSSLLALKALTCDDPEDAEAMREESGIAKLESVLSEQVVQRAGVLGDANLLRETLNPLAIADRSLYEQLSALRPDGVARKGLEQEQSRLKQLGTDRADWPRKLDTEIRRITLYRSEMVSMGLTEVRRRYDDRLKDPTKQDVESLPGELVADLTALAGRVNEDSANRLTALLESVLDDIDASSDLHDAIERVTADHLTDQLTNLGIGNYALNHYDKLSVLSSFSSGRSLSTLLTGSGLGLTAGTLIAPPIGIAIGLGLGGFYAYQAFKGKRRQTFGTEFKGWMGEQCSQTQTTVNTTFQREVIDVQDEMRRVVRDALAEREAQITESLKKSQALLEAAADEQAKAKDEMGARRDAIRQLQKQVTDHLTSLGKVRLTDEPAKGGPAVAQH